MQIKRFAANWSVSVCIISMAIILLAVAVVGWMAREASDEADQATASLLMAGVAILPVVVCITVLFAPLGYVVCSEGIVIHRMGRSLGFGFEQIASIRKIGADEIGFGVRVFGSGGLFGWFGRFYGSRLGWFTAYSSNRRDLVLVVLSDGGQIVISPHPATEFLATVEAAMRRAGECT